MSEKVLAFSIKILGTDTEIKNIAQLKSNLTSVTDALQKADLGSSEFKLLTNQANDLNAELNKLKLQNEATKKSFESLKLPVGSFNQLKAELAANEARLKNASVGINISQEAFDKLQRKVLENKQALADFNAGINLNKKPLTDITSLIKQGVDVYNVQNNSINENRKLLKLLGEQYRDLKSPTAEQTAELKTLTDTLKKQESAYGDNRRNVGAYSDAFKDATTNVKIFGVSLGELQTQFNTYKSVVLQGTADIKAYATGQVAADGATKLSIISTTGLSVAMNVLKLALIATGIGAFVVLLGSLVAALATTQRGVDLVENAMGALSGIFQSTLGVAQNLGNKLLDLFSNPKQAAKDLLDFLQNNLLNRLKSFGVIIDGIVNFDTKKVTNGVAQLATGVENLTDKLENSAKATAKFLGDAAKRGQEIVAIEKEIEDLEAAINKRRAEFQSRETELLITAKSAASTDKERKAATDEILSNAKELQKFEEAIVVKKIEALKLSQSQNDTDRKGNKELQDLEAELIKVRDSGKEKQLQLIKLLNKEEKESIKNAEDAAKKKLDAEKKYLEDLAKLSDEFLLNERQRIEKSFNDKLALITGNGQKEIEVRKAIEAAKVKAIEDFEKKQNEIFEAKEQERIELLQQALFNRLQTELIELEIAGKSTLQKQLEIEDAKQIAILENDKITLDEKEKLIAESNLRIKQLYDEDAENAVNAEREKRDKMIALISEYLNTAGSLNQQASAIVQEFGNRELEEFQEGIDQRISGIQKLEDKIANSSGRQKAIYQQQLDAQKRALEKDEAEKERIRLKFARAKKATDIIQAGISGALATVNALASVPFPANIAAAIATGALAAVQIGLIASAKLNKGAALGNGDISNVSGGNIPRESGVISGPGHDSGGVKFMYNGRNYEAEGGEIKTNNGKERFIFTRGVNNDPVLRRIAMATHNNSGHPVAKMVGSLVNSYAGGRPFYSKYGRALMQQGGSLSNVTGSPLQPVIVTTATTDPNILKLISDVNEGNMIIAAKFDERLNKIENQKLVVPVDRVTELQSNETTAREAGFF